MSDINNVYSYIITKIDEELEEYMESNPNIHKLFSSGDIPIYYYPNGVLKDKNGEKRFCHVYIIDTDSIYTDSNSRNRVFLDILKRS